MVEQLLLALNVVAVVVVLVPLVEMEPHREMVEMAAMELPLLFLVYQLIMLVVAAVLTSPDLLHPEVLVVVEQVLLGQLRLQQELQIQEVAVVVLPQAVQVS